MRSPAPGLGPGPETFPCRYGSPIGNPGTRSIGTPLVNGIGGTSSASRSSAGSNRLLMWVGISEYSNSGPCA
jgi:hypothetical protein